MLQQLPTYLVRSDVGVFSELPRSVSLSEEIEELPSVKIEEELCIICMSEIAV